MIRLYLNNQEVDIEQSGFRQTKQVNDIGDIGNRKANFTNTFQCPLTANNLVAFANLGVPGNISDIPYQRPTAIVEENGIQVIGNGFAVVNETTNAYEVVVYDGAISLSEFLGEQTLRDLDYSSINHDLDLQTYLDSFSNIDTYIYGFARYDFQLFRPAFFINVNSPSIFVSTLWDFIFTQNNLTYSGDIFGKEKFLNKVVSMGEGFVQNILTTPVDIDSGTDAASPLVDNMNSPLTVTITTVNIATTGNYDVFIDSVVTYNPTRTEVLLRIVVNGNPVLSYDHISGDYLDTTSYNLVAGDILVIEYLMTRLASNQFVPYEIEWDIDLTNKRVPIAFEDIIFDDLQFNFVKKIIQIFGLIYQQRGERDFEFIELEILLRDRVNAEDWSQIYDSTNNIEYRDNNYGQTTFIDFNYDSNYDLEDKDFARGSFPVNDVNLDLEKNLFVSNFTATSQDLDTPELYPILLPVLQLFHFEDDGSGGVAITEDDFRFFQIETQNTLLNIRFSDDLFGLLYSGDVPFLAQPTWDDLIDDSYTALEEMFVRYQKREMLFDLSTIDFLNADFLRLKYIDKLGDYFYLNKIANYQTGQLNRIDLIRTKADPVFLTGNALVSVAEWDDTNTSENRAQISAPPFNFAITAESSTPLAEITEYRWQRRIVPLPFQSLAATQLYNESLTTTGVYEYRVAIKNQFDEIEYSNVLQMDYTTV